MQFKLPIISLTALLFANGALSCPDVQYSASWEPQISQFLGAIVDNEV
jgi:hypothetical protein